MKFRTAAGVFVACLALASGSPALCDERPSGVTTQSEPAKAQTAAPQFVLDGGIETPVAYDKSILAGLPATTVKVRDNSYTGVTLWSLLDRAGIKTNPEIKNELLRKLIIVTARDGYKVAVSLGEIDPMFGNEPCLVAYQQNGADFRSGFAHLVFPNDVKRARWAHDIASITVIDAP